MNDTEKQRCLEFAQLALGRAARKSDIQALIDSNASLAEFRIALVLNFENTHDGARRVAQKWRESMRAIQTSSDGNDLTHAVEVLTLRHAEIEKKLREGTADMLDKLKAIDGLATLQADLRTRMAEIDELIHMFRNRTAQMEHVRSDDAQGANP